MSTQLRSWLKRHLPKLLIAMLTAGSAPYWLTWLADKLVAKEGEISVLSARLCPSPRYTEFAIPDTRSSDKEGVVRLDGAKLCMRRSDRASMLFFRVSAMTTHRHPEATAPKVAVRLLDSSGKPLETFAVDSPSAYVECGKNRDSDPIPLGAKLNYRASDVKSIVLEVSAASPEPC